MKNILAILRSQSSFWRKSLSHLLTKKIEKLENPSQAALLIYVFRRQKTTPVLDIVKENNIIAEYVPNNMTNYYQQLDCTKGFSQGKI